MKTIRDFLSFTEARNTLTAVMDAAQAYQPQRIRKRKASEDDVIVISAPLLLQALSAAGTTRFHISQHVEKDGSSTFTLAPFDLAVNAPTREQAIASLLNDVRFYAEEYMAHRSLYLRAPNRREHLPLVLLVILASDDGELKEMLGVA
jgi:hypothetical protein